MKRLTRTRVLLWIWLAVLAGAPAWSDAAPPAIAKARVAFGDFTPNLPVLLLDATESISAEVKVPCTIRVVCPTNSSCGETNRLSAAVQYHGATSQRFPKKSFKLTLEQPARLLDLRLSSHWVLNAAYIDRSLMRHKLSYDLFRSLSSPGGNRFAAGSRFVEVFFNGRYHGAYLLMERVDRELLQLRPYRSNEVSHACIYKAIDHAANFGDSGHSGYEQREPDPIANPYWDHLDEFNEFVSTAPDAKFFDPKAGIGSRLDLDNAIDFHLLVLLTANGDGITKNFIMGRDAHAAGQPDSRFFFVPWDYDGTFGRNWNAEPFSSSSWLSNHLFDRLLGQRAYRDRFIARWNQLRGREFSVQAVQGRIDANARTLGEAARRNFFRWPTTAHDYPDDLTFEEDISEMKSWVKARLAWLDSEIKHQLDSH